MSRVDIHVHTNKSDGAGTVAEVLEAASSKPELLAIAITDHNEISGALEAAKRAHKYGVKVIVGEEISTLAGHVIGIFLKEKIDKGLTPEETIREIHRQGGVAIIPHPYPHYRGVGVEIVATLIKSPNPQERPDAVEVRNGFPAQLVFHNQIKKLNLKSWNLAEVGGSDSHHPRSLGSCWTDFDGGSVEEFRKALTERQTRAAGNGWGILETARATVQDAGRHIRRRFRD